MNKEVHQYCFFKYSHQWLILRMFLFLFRLPELDIYYLCHQLGVLKQLRFPMGWKGLLCAALPLASYLNRAIR